MQNQAVAMTATLIRAANELSRHRPFISEFLHESIVLISELRAKVGIPGVGTRGDAIVRLNAVASDTRNRSDTVLSSALLEAAEMIRTLHMLVDSGIEVRVVKSSDIAGESEILFDHDISEPV